MLTLDPADLENIRHTALASAAILRRCGETAKADRVESLARIVARQLQAAERNGPLDRTGAVLVVATPDA